MYNKQIAANIDSGVYKLLPQRKHRSIIWSVLSEIVREDNSLLPDLVYCKNCHKILKYPKNATSNLARHTCVRDFKLAKAKEEKPKQSVESCDKQKAIDACAAWAIKDCRAATSVSGSAFMDLAQFFIKIGATYGESINLMELLPDPAHIFQKLQSSAAEKRCALKTEVIEAVSSCNAAAMIQMWPDCYVKRNFLAVTLRHNRGDKFFDTFLGLKSMDFERSTAADIYKKLSSLFSEYGLENVGSLKFVTQLDKTIAQALESVVRLNCSSDLFGQVLNKSFAETAEICEILDCCRKLLKHMDKNKLQSPDEYQYAAGWTADYNMLKLFTNNWSDTAQAIKQQHKENLTLDTIQQIVELCKNFEIALQTIQLSDMPTLCFVVPTVQKIRSICLPNHADCSSLLKLKANILKNIEQIWLANLSIWHKAAYFLYPPAVSMQPNDMEAIKQFCIERMQKLEFDKHSIQCDALSEHDESSLSAISDSFADYKRNMQFLFSDFMPDSSIAAAPETLQSEFNRYSGFLMNFSDNFNLIAWWQSNANTYPHLSKIALEIHAIPASSTAAEKILALAGNIVSEKRNELGPRLVDNLLFLHSHHKSFED